MTAPTPAEISALLAPSPTRHAGNGDGSGSCPDCRRTGQLLAVGVAVGFMAGVALCVVAVYLVLSSAA